jgi:hypothetical protein
VLEHNARRRNVRDKRGWTVSTSITARPGAERVARPALGIPWTFGLFSHERSGVWAESSKTLQPARRRTTSTSRCRKPPAEKFNATSGMSASRLPSSAPRGVSTMNFFVCSLHAHWKCEEFCHLRKPRAQRNQDRVCSKRAAFFASITSKVGHKHIMAKATALPVNLYLAPSCPLLHASGGDKLSVIDRTCTRRAYSVHARLALSSAGLPGGPPPPDLHCYSRPPHVPDLNCGGRDKCKVYVGHSIR